MMERLDAKLGVILLVGTLLVAGAATWSAYSGTAALPGQDSYQARSANYAASILLGHTTAKPLVTTRAGEKLLDLPGTATTILVNGTTTSLYLLDQQASQDGRVLMLGWAGPGYDVTERVQVNDDGVVVDWLWTRHHDAGPQEADVEIGHFAPGLTTPRIVDPQTLRYHLASDLDGRGLEVQITFSQPPGSVWVGRTPTGFDAFHVSQHVHDPPARLATPFLSERITYVRSEQANATGTLPESRQFGSVYESADRYVVSNGVLRADVSLRDGHAKPLLLTAAGRPLLDVSAADTTLVVDGREAPLNAGSFNVSGQGDALSVNWTGPGYEILQAIRLDGATAIVSWDWVGGNASRVEMRVAQFAPFMTNLSADGSRAVFSLTPQQLDVGSPPNLSVELVQGGIAGFTGGSNGTDAMRWGASAQTHGPLAAERISLVDTPTPTGSSPVVLASPFYDAESNAWRLVAGGTNASIALGKGPDKPLFRTVGGVPILEISGAGSQIVVDNVTSSFYDGEWRLRDIDGLPCIVWTEPSVLLRECIEARADAAIVRWSWNSTSSRDAKVILAHFAPILENFTSNASALAYEHHDASGEADSVTVALDAPPGELLLGQTPRGIDAFRLVYFLPANGGTWTPFLSERIAYERI